MESNIIMEMYEKYEAATSFYCTYTSLSKSSLEEFYYLNLLGINLKTHDYSLKVYTSLMILLFVEKSKFDTSIGFWQCVHIINEV